MPTFLEHKSVYIFAQIVAETPEAKLPLELRESECKDIFTPILKILESV